MTMAGDDSQLDENEDLFNFDALDQATPGSGPGSAKAEAAPAPAASDKAGSRAHGASARAGDHDAPKAKSAASAAPSRSAPQKPVDDHGPIPATPSSARAAARANRGAAPVEVARPGAVELAEGPRTRAAESGERVRDAASRASNTKHRPRALSQILLACALLGNLALVGVVWRSMKDMSAALVRDEEPATRSTGHDEDHLGAPPKHASQGAPVSRAPEIEPIGFAEPQGTAPDPQEGELALETAAEEIRLGEFERARARLYSLLSVLDRFAPTERSGLASRAQVLVADSYRAQADELERQVAGFVPADGSPPPAAPDLPHKEQHL